MKTLALQLKRLGDLVLTTPALEHLRSEGEVTLAVWGAAEGLLPLLPQISGAIVFGTGRGWTPWQQVIWGGFDRVVDFTGTDRSALVTAFAHARERRSFTAEQASWWRRSFYNQTVNSPVRDRHTIEHLGALAGGGGEMGPRLEVPARALEQARQLAGQGDFVVVHAGTARAEKLWLPERWAEVINHLQERQGLKCLLTGGDAAEEQAHLGEIARNCIQPPRNFAGALDLPTLAALLSEARLVLSVDTVAMHLAAAWQRPQVALFGPTNPFHWRPRHASARIFSAHEPGGPLTHFEPRMPGAPMAQLSTTPIIRATDELLSR